MHCFYNRVFITLGKLWFKNASKELFQRSRVFVYFPHQLKANVRLVANIENKQTNTSINIMVWYKNLPIHQETDRWICFSLQSKGFLWICPLFKYTFTYSCVCLKKGSIFSFIHWGGWECVSVSIRGQVRGMVLSFCTCNLRTEQTGSGLAQRPSLPEPSLKPQ